MKLRILEPNADLCYTGWAAACDLYASGDFDASPSCLLLSPELTERAYELLVGYPSLRRVPVVPVPGVGAGFWAFLGPAGIAVGNIPW